MSKASILLNATTCFITEHFDNYGNPITKVMTKQDSYEVPLRAQKLIDVTLRMKGNDLYGSIRSAKKILRKKKLLPILMDLQEEFLLVPLYSPRKANTFYFNPMAVADMRPITQEKTAILFLNGDWITVPFSQKYIFNKIFDSYRYLRLIHYYNQLPLNLDDLKKLF